jgi:two-component sensor histidine kinase
VDLARDGDELVVDVVDDGAGLPSGFTLDEAKGLGLSIVHALVTSELGGSIELLDDHGTRVHLRIPLRQAERVEL